MQGGGLCARGGVIAGSYGKFTRNSFRLNVCHILFPSFCTGRNFLRRDTCIFIRNYRDVSDEQYSGTALLLNI